MIEIRDSTQAVANRTIELLRKTQVGDYPTNQTQPHCLCSCAWDIGDRPCEKRASPSLPRHEGPGA